MIKNLGKLKSNEKDYDQLDTLKDQLKKGKIFCHKCLDIPFMIQLRKIDLCLICNKCLTNIVPCDFIYDPQLDVKTLFELNQLKDLQINGEKIA